MGGLKTRLMKINTILRCWIIVIFTANWKSLKLKERNTEKTIFWNSSTYYCMYFNVVRLLRLKSTLGELSVDYNPMSSCGMSAAFRDRCDHQLTRSLDRSASSSLPQLADRLVLEPPWNENWLNGVSSSISVMLLSVPGLAVGGVNATLSWVNS